MTYHTIIAALFTVLIAFPVGAAGAVEKFITLVGTTSTDNSGLYGKILPLFIAKTGIKVRVVSVGTGRAIKRSLAAARRAPDIAGRRLAGVGQHFDASA